MKKLFFGVVLSIGLFVSNFSFAQPKFNEQVQDGLSSIAYDPKNLNVQSDTNLQENIKCLFAPGSSCGEGKGGYIYDYLRNIGIGVIVIYLFVVGAQLLFGADKEKDVQKNLKSLGFIAYGILLFIGANWLVTSVGTFDYSGAQDLPTTIDNTTYKILKTVIAFMKNGIYFLAIAMIIYYGYRMIISSNMDDKVKAARTGILNVAIALVLVKIIDFLFYIATQNSFKNDATKFIVSATKVVGWLVGVVMVIMIIYAGIQLITSRGDEAIYKKAIATIRNVFIVAIVIMIFLLIIYQVFSNLGG